MELTEFAGLVVKMRLAQQKYFKERTQENLFAAKKAEAEVDKAVKLIAFKAEEKDS